MWEDHNLFVIELKESILLKLRQDILTELKTKNPDLIID